MATKLTKSELEALRKSNASGQGRNAMSKAQLESYRKSSSKNWTPIEYYKKYDLQTEDGKSFGKVSYDAYKAIESGTLDGYTPTPEEEKVISEFIKQPIIPLAIEVDGEKKDFGKVSYEAYKAIESGAIENYTAVNDSEKKAIDNYIKFAEEYAKEQREPENFGQGLLHGVGYTLEKLGAGATDFVADMGNVVLAGGATVLRPFTWGSWNKGLQNFASTQLNSDTLGDMWSESAESRYRVPDWYRQYGGTTAEGVGALAVPMAIEYATMGLAPTEGYTAAQLAKMASRTSNASKASSFATKLATKLAKPKTSEIIFGLGATGSATKEAYKQSGDLGKAYTYGILNGLGEMATERLFGGFGGTNIGPDELIDVHKLVSKIPKIGKLASTKYGAKVLDIAFEGVEELMMAGADPVFQKITFNPDAKIVDLYKNAGFGESFFQGILLSSAMNASTYTLSKGINVANKTKAINTLNKSAKKINATLPNEASKFEPLKFTATINQINERNSELARIDAINNVNVAIDGINALFPNDADKLEPLKYDSTIDEIKQRQNEIQVFATGYADLMVEELVKNNPEKFNDVETTPTEKTSSTVAENTTVETPATVPVAEPVATEQRNTFTEELDEIASTEMPTVSVGDTFIESGTNKIIKVIGRNESVTNIELTTPSGKKETKLLTNKKADTLVVDDKYSKVETSAKPVSSPAVVVAENATTTTETVEPQAEKPSVSVGDVYESNATGTTYTVTDRDAENTTMAVTNKQGATTTRTMTNVVADSSFVNSEEVTKVQDGNAATTTEAENISVTDESVSVDKGDANSGVALAEGEILSLKHTKNIYSLFKGAKRVAVGEDCITDGVFAIPLTDKTLEEVKKVYKGEIETKENLQLSKLYHKDNDVIIQGNPKVDNTERNLTSYVFDIAGNLYVAQQKYIDAFNKDGNVIKANSKDYRVPWTVHDKNGSFIAIIMPMRVRENPEVYYGDMLTVKDILDANKQKRAEKSKAKEVMPEVEAPATEDTQTETQPAKEVAVSKTETTTKEETTPATETKTTEEVLKNQPESATIEEKTAMQTLNDELDNVIKKSAEDVVAKETEVVAKTYDVAYLEKVCSDIRKGESVSLETMRTAVDAIILNHGEAIKAELSQLKNDELKKQLNIYDRGRVTKKADMVDAIYSDMVSNMYFAISGKDTISYVYDGSGFGNQQEKMLFDISRELTEEKFTQRLAENAEKYQKQRAEREEKISKIKNPQTVEEFAYKKKYFGLSEEETIQYENLYAEDRRKAREEKKATKTTKDTSGADDFFANSDNYTIEKTTHTKSGEDVWVVRPVNRLETDEWKQLNEQMKALGGSYWRGNQGWNFKKDPTASLTSTEETDTETVKGSSNAEKLRNVANGMQKTIDDKFKDRLTNTAKRAREAASAEAEGERLKRLQTTINNIAEALENGESTLLDKIDSKAQVETLMLMLNRGQRNRISETLPDITYAERLKEQDKPYSNDDVKYAEYPLTKLHESAISEYIRAAEGKTGYKQITDRLKKSLKTVKNGYVNVDAQLFADIDKIVKNLSTYRDEFWNDGIAERKRLARMGIENVVELRAYLRDFITYLPGRNAEAEKQRSIKDKERQLANAKIEGFFPTPKVIVEQMLDEADINPGETVLEPSAGKGNIADEIKAKYPDNTLDVVEWNASLNELLSEKGHNVVGEDFLKTSGKYDKIIMNPPFEKGQDIDHIKHAYSLLNDGGRVVCIMSEGPFYRSDKKATEFREWLDEVGGVSEKLPDGSFKTAERSTGVNTRLVVIDKTTTTPDDGKRYSIDNYAPAFYSHMGKTIDEIKQDKIGANSVISYLKGRGVKDEEIKWSGIETFLDGKKSVTKAELQEFVASNQLQIEETVLDGSQSTTLEIQEVGRKDLYVMRGGEIYDSLTWDSSTYTWVSDAYGFYFDSMPRIRNYYGVNENGTRWGDYKLKGGENYREITFKMPDSTYSNQMMKTHWGENAEGIIAHARIQDFDVDGKKMLFIEEIQSDWHNQGHKKGYVDKVVEPDLSNYEIKKLGNAPNRRDYFVWGLFDKTSGIRVSSAIRATEQDAWSELTDTLIREEKRSQVPDAPFRNNYHEYVLKSLIRMAAEQGYESIGWTPADVQSERWSNDYAEGYRIEYDQEIPKFLNKYGKKWGAKVGQTEIAKEDGGWYEVEGTTVWSMDITDSMKESVLYEGQALYSIEREGNSNEQVREDLLSGNGRRGSDESTRKQAERISSFKQRNQGKDGAERQRFARQLLEQGQTEEVIDGTDKYTLVKPEAYNDDMLSMVEEAKSKGLEVGFFIGNAKIKFDTKDEFKVDGIKVSESKILVQYDGIRTPQSIIKHEGVHSKWNTPEMQKIKDTILNGLSETDKENILSQDRYKRYMTIYKGNKAIVFEEFVADVMSGMNEYTAKYIDVVTDFWYGDESIDRYSPADYTNSIDAGGNETVLDNIGFGDEYRLSESGESNENTNSIGVEERGTYQNNDSVWQRSDDSEGLYRSVGNGKTLLRGSEEKGFGLIDWSRKFGTLNVNDSKEKGHAYGFLRKISELKIADNDSLGRKLPKAVKDYFGQTVLKNSRGELVPLYHATDEKFDIFNYGDFGFHIGNWEQATHLNKKFIKEVYIDVKNPMYIPVDSMHWYGMVIANRALSQDIINRNEYDSISKLDGFFGMDYNSEANIALRELLKEKGYDGIIYNNGFEGKDISVMAFDSKQIKYTSNQNPTALPDTRYSFSVDDDIDELTPERKKEIFEQFERDRVGVDKPTQKQIWGERAEYIAHNMTRVFPDIPERGEKGIFFAEFRKMMIQWKALPQTSMFMTQDKLNQMTKDLTPDEFKTFSELVYFLDLQEEAQIQQERGYEEILLPNEITPLEVNQIVDVLNKEATDNVKKALEKRRQIWDNLKEQYITLNQYIGFDTDGKFNRKNYYHHQVIEYMNQGGKGVAKGKDIEIKAGRGWLKERQGSTKATNTDFLAVEYKAMLQMQYDIYVANMLGKIKDQYDIKPQLEKQAFNHNKEFLNDIIIKESTGEDGNRIFDSKMKPDSETYRQQQWYNQRIMFGFSGLFDLAEAGILPTFNGQYGNVIRALENHNLNAPGLYTYVGELASMELPETATDEELQARISARTVLKYTSQKKAWVKETLADDYQTWESLANDMRDTHSIHQPRRGNYFYTKTTIDEDAFNKAFNDMIVGLVAGENGVDTTADMKKLFEQYSETVRLMGAAYEQWVIPNEIEVTMNKVANPKQVGVVSQTSRTILSAWKGWSTSVNPLRTVKFGIRNIFGDLDAVIAGNPKVVVYSKQAVEEIYQAMKHKNYSDEFMGWVERGGFSSLIFANEMDTEMQDKIFSHLKDKEGLNIFKIPAKLFEGYYNGVETAHNFREAILRYSAYLYFKNDIIKNGGKVKDNVASNRYIVQGLQSVEDKAYQLSKDLLGAYDEVATMGQALRRHAIPFYSFTETNLKRYYRLFENIIMSDDNIPKKAGKLLLKALMVNALALIMVAWNKLVMKDEDDELPPSVRNIPHITLGKVGDDVYAFRQLGSFSELLEWVGLDDYQWTKEDLTAPLDKAVGMITPVAKTPVELLTGLNFYPSITQPRAIRDKVEHLFSTLGVDDVYRVVAGKPTKGIVDIAKGALTYSYDSKESAYYEILDIKREYQGDTDNTIYGQTPKSNALYYMKTAIRYKDKKAALKYLDEYFENGGTGKGISQSMEMLNPMYGYTGKDTIAKGQEFVNSLNDDEKDKLKVAINYYENDLMLPEKVSAMLRKKGITDEQAKNLLTNYINSKCK